MIFSGVLSAGGGGGFASLCSSTCICCAAYAAPLAARLGANVNPEPAEMKVMRDPGIRELISVHGQVKTACHIMASQLHASTLIVTAFCLQGMQNRRLLKRLLRWDFIRHIWRKWSQRATQERAGRYPFRAPRAAHAARAARAAATLDSGVALWKFWHVLRKLARPLPITALARYPAVGSPPSSIQSTRRM